MDNGEELAYVVGSLLIGSLMEDLSASIDIDTTIFHSAWILAAGSVDCPASGYDFGDKRVVHFILAARCIGNGTQHATSLLVISVAPSLDSVLLVVEALVASPLVALGAQLALGPGVANSRLSAHPHNIPFSLIARHNYNFFNGKGK